MMKPLNLMAEMQVIQWVTAYIGHGMLDACINARLLQAALFLSPTIGKCSYNVKKN